MTEKCSLIQMLLLTSWGFIHCKVDPPKDLVITDPGHLGYLDIKWSPSAEFVPMSREQGQCSVQYELHYYNTYSSSWTSIRTTQTSFRAQFDLARDVQVRVYTLISGACADGGTVKSQNYTEVVQKPDMTGTDGIQDLTCVYHNMEHTVCSWTRSPKMPKHAQETLYYWHRALAHAEECPHYIISDGLRSGCNFSGTDLPTFSAINLCVNASSLDCQIKPLYTSLQIQNYVKPKTTEKINVEMGPDMQLRSHWDSPAGRIPIHCLQWQVEDSREGRDGKHTLQQIISAEAALTLALLGNETSCLRVRSSLNKYCAKSSVWSDWSLPVCYPDKKLPPSTSRWHMFPQYMYIAVSIITALALGLCVWAGITLRRSRQVKKMDCLARAQFQQVVQHCRG